MDTTRQPRATAGPSGQSMQGSVLWLAACLALGFASLSGGATLYWDTIDDSDGLDGGNGTWSTSATNWNTSATGANTPLANWTNSSDAVFNSSGAFSVAASGTPQAQNITFMQGNVTTSGDIRLLGGGKLLLDTGGGDTLLASVRQENSTTFENRSTNLLTITNLNRVSGSTSFAFAGAGNITVSTLANTQSGTITKNDAGTLRINAFTNTSGTKFTVNGGVLWINTSVVSGTNSPTSSTADNAVTLNGGTLRTSHNRIYGLGNGAAGPHGIFLGASGGTLEQDSGTTFTQAGLVSGCGTLTKSGSGTLILSNSTNSYNGTTAVEQGTLEATVDGALGNTTAVDLEGGTLLLKKSGGGASTIVNNAAAITLDGGALKTNDALTEELGTLTLSSSSTIDLNALGTLKFAASNAVTWAGGATLSIHNWIDHASSGIYFGTTSGGLTSGQLSQIEIFSDSGLTSLGAPAIAGDGELVLTPIPEPGTVAMALLLGLSLAWRERGALSVLIFRRRPFGSL